MTQQGGKAHTAGPWKVADDAIDRVVGADGRKVADVAIAWRASDTVEANAALIAAAPDLLAVAMKSLSWLSSYPGGGADAMYEEMRAAIAKATKGE